MQFSTQTKNNRRLTIAIIGGGFSGSMLAVHLLQAVNSNVSIALIERDSTLGYGVAYGTRFEGHLLNVRAKNMSAYPDAPDHFVQWAQRYYSSSVKPGDFLPRPVYGEYIASLISEATRSHADRFRRIRDEAVSLTTHGGSAEIRLAGGKTFVADKVVLAIGHFPPADLALPGKTNESVRFIASPWSSDSLANASRSKSVLLIGSGLTSVDVAIELRERGFEGIIHLLSRHGLLPQSHKIVASSSLDWDEQFPRTARELLRLIRSQIKKAEESGSDWRAVIDSLRPFTQTIWRSLPLQEQKRFLRHLRAYWDVHRHRIAGRIADQLEGQLRNGRMRAHAGRIAEYREDDSAVHIAYRNRESGRIDKFSVDHVINCTGPNSDLRRVASPLLSDLFAKKLAHTDVLRLGLDVAEDGALLNADGVASDLLYAVGPLRKGLLWESIAVPELRVQVPELAKVLLNSLSSPNSGLRQSSLTEASLVPNIADPTEEPWSSSSSTSAA